MFKHIILYLLFCIIVCFSSLTYGSSVDPTSPLGHSPVSMHQKTKQKLILESIIHGDGIHTAVINGKVMKPSDTIGEYRLTAINDHSVVLRSKTQRLKLHIFNQSAVNVSVVR